MTIVLIGNVSNATKIYVLCVDTHRQSEGFCATDAGIQSRHRPGGDVYEAVVEVERVYYYLPAEAEALGEQLCREGSERDAWRRCVEERQLQVPSIGPGSRL